MIDLSHHSFEDVIIDAPSIEALLNGPNKHTIKWGADPSAPDLHLGHAVILNQLAAFQAMGHHVFFVIGDFTAQIGDPTGKSTTRPSLSQSDVQQNASTYLDQVFKILDKKNTTIFYNSKWLNQLKPSDMISLCAKITVARMLERDDFSQRFKQQTPIGIHEFLYPLLQGYDSVHLKNTIEIGGTDQKFNFLVGRQLQKEAGIPPQNVLTLPILEGLDGSKKMSKSLNNHIGILDTPNDMFGKCMSIPDSLIMRYLTLLTHATPMERMRIKNQLDTGVNPRTIKLELAHTLVSRFHSQADAASAKENFINVFSKKALPNDIPEAQITADIPEQILSLLCHYSLASSKKEGRRLIKQGAVSINGCRVLTPDQTVTIKPNTIIRVGKRSFLKLISSQPDPKN